MKILTAISLLPALALSGLTFAAAPEPPVPPAAAIGKPAEKPATTRSRLPIAATTTVAPGQAGYVHFFIITDPEGELETQLGVELDDQRIAWSVPGIGVNVSPFIASGTIGSGDKLFKVRHLYGIRAFPDDAAMRALQRSMLSRVIPLVEDDTPYCYLRPRHGAFCMNCLGFVMRVLFPGPTADFPTLPHDFARRDADAFYTTEDMLLYLAGMHGIATPAARHQRLAQLDIPQKLRDDLLLLINDSELNSMKIPADFDSAKAPPPRSLVRRPRVPGPDLKTKPDPRPAKPL